MSDGLKRQNITGFLSELAVSAVYFARPILRLERAQTFQKSIDP